MKGYKVISKFLCIFIAVLILLPLLSCSSSPVKKADSKAETQVSSEQENTAVQENTDVQKRALKQVDTSKYRNAELEAAIEKQEAVFSKEIDFSKAAAMAGSGFSLGNAKLELDEERSTSVEYKPLGKAVSMELEDEKGNVWRLDIPENALLHNETITMQIVRDVESGIFSEKMSGGVVLEPDGLQFLSPARLSVKGPSVTEHTFVLSGNKEGKNINFAYSEAGGNSASTEIKHFSSYLVLTPQSDSRIEEAANKAEAAYNEVLKEVKAFLKTSISIPPIPLDYEFVCKEEEDGVAGFAREKILSLYTYMVISPELDLINKILGAGKEAANLDREQEGIYYAGLLQKRNIKKINQLYNRYKSDNKKLIPLINVTFSVLYDAQYLGLDEPLGPYLESYSDWTARAADELLDKIKSEHDYKKLGAVLALVKGSVMLNTDVNVTSEFTRKYLQKIKDAMTFKVKYEASLFVGLGNQRMKVSGEAKLSPDIDNEKNYTAEGEGSYLSYSHSGPGNTTIDFPNKYPVKVSFKDFVPCKMDKLKVHVDKIGADVEVWYSRELNVKSSDEYNFVNFIAENLLADYRDEEGGYIFELPFRNKNSVFGPENFTKTDTVMLEEDGESTASITYNLRVEHTPK